MPIYRFFTLLFFLLCNSFAVFAQTDTVEYLMNRVKEKSSDPEFNYYYRLAYKDGVFWTVKDFYLETRTIEMRGQFADDSLKLKEGVFTYYYPNGQVAQKRRYVHDKIESLSKDFDTLGRLQDSAYYIHGVPCKVHYSWYGNRQLSFKGIYDDSGSGAGQEWLYYSDGTLKGIGLRTEGYLKDSVWTYFYKSGAISAREYYKKGLRENKECFDIDGQPQSGACDSFTAPVFPKSGGSFSKYLTSELVFPSGYKIKDYGIVIVEFFIEEDGTISNLQLPKGLHPVFDKEVIYTIKKSPNWMPAKEYNHPVRFRYYQAIVFQ